MAETKEVKEKIDLSDVENGPVTEANRECRDIFCCLLFLAAIGGMVYLTIYGYMNGNPAAIFRGVDLNGIACGDPKGVAAAFPYIYFVTPAAEISKRYCVVACPSFSGTALTALSCYGATCTYTYQYNSAYTLSPSGAPGSNDIIGYESISVIDRICVPTTVQFTKFAGI